MRPGDLDGLARRRGGREGHAVDWGGQRMTRASGSGATRAGNRGLEDVLGGLGAPRNQDPAVSSARLAVNSRWADIRESSKNSTISRRATDERVGGRLIGIDGRNRLTLAAFPRGPVSRATSRAIRRETGARFAQ